MCRVRSLSLSSSDIIILCFKVLLLNLLFLHTKNFNSFTLEFGTVF